MSSANFTSANTSKITEFEKKSKEVCKEFNAIKEEFKRINNDLLNAWGGLGAGAYKFETDNILEKIGSVDDVLQVINNVAVKGIRDNYSKLDNDLGEFNKNPYKKGGH